MFDPSASGLWVPHAPTAQFACQKDVQTGLGVPLRFIEGWGAEAVILGWQGRGRGQPGTMGSHVLLESP